MVNARPAGSGFVTEQALSTALSGLPAPSVGNGTISTAKLADNAVTAAKIAAGLYLLGDTNGYEQLGDWLGNTFLQGGTYDDPGNRYILPTGGTSSPFGTLVYTIPASDLTPFPSAGTEAQKMAAINANDARVIHEMVTRPGVRVECDWSQWWPLSGVIDEFVGTYTKPDGTTGNLVEGADYALGGRFLLVKGSRTSATDTSANVVQAGAVLTVIRRNTQGGLVVTPSNLRTVVLGGNNPNLGVYFTGACSGFDATANLNLYKAGAAGDLVSMNDYGWSKRAGYGDGTAGTGVYKGTFWPIAGLCVNITGYTLTALNTALGNPSPAVASLERRVLVGAQSGNTFMVQGGDYGSTVGQLVANSVSGATFTAGEDLNDQATGAKVAVYGSTTVLMRGILDDTYDNTPQFRFCSSGRVDLTQMSVKVDSDPDDYLRSYNRPDAVYLAGCTYVNVNGLRILSGYGAGLVLRSCYDVRGEPYIRDLPNHAIKAPSIIEDAYGYAIRLLGHCQAVFLKIDVMRVRHGLSTNGIRGTWNLNSRTGSSSGATSLCTNFWNHGPGARLCTFSGKVENTWSACWDFHEGARFITLLNCGAVQPTVSGRATTIADGFNLRGFGIRMIGCYAVGCRVGVYNLAGPLVSDGLSYRNSVIGGQFLDCQAGGILHSEDDYDETVSSHEYIGNVFSCDPNARGAYPQQFGMLLRRGSVSVIGNSFTGVGYAYLRLTTYVDGNGEGSNATGLLLLKDNLLDWTNATASRAVSLESTWADVTEIRNHCRVNPGGTTRPLNYNVNSGGNSSIRHSQWTCSFLSTNLATPSKTTSTTGGAPTTTDLDVGSSGGGTSVYAAGLDADVAQPGTDNVVTDVAGLQVTLPAGTYLFEAELLVQAGTASAGALRTGIGGAGAAGMAVTNIDHHQFTSATGSTVTALTALGTVQGLSPGATVILPHRIRGRLVVTSGGVVGAQYLRSTGATSTFTVKAGSYVSFTKVA